MGWYRYRSEHDVWWKSRCLSQIEDVVVNDYAQDFLYLSLPQPAWFALHDDDGSGLLLIDIVDCMID